MSESFKPLTGWTEEYFKSFDGAELFCRFYDPPKSRHTLIILHGHGEHTGRYLKFSKKLKEAPVRLALFDYRGMGRSEGRSPGARSVEELLKDVTAFVEYVRKKYGLKDKVILMGHSLGGLLAIDWAMQNPSAIKRLILSAPFLGITGLPLLRAVNALVKSVFPEHVYHNPVMPKHLSHDAAEVAIYRKDPLIKRNISARLIGSIIEEIICLKKKEAVTMPFSVKILTAGDERIVDPRAARKFFDRLVAPKKEFISFPGFYHEIFNEEGQNQAFNVLKTILEECV